MGWFVLKHIFSTVLATFSYVRFLESFISQIWVDDEVASTGQSS